MINLRQIKCSKIRDCFLSILRFAAEHLFLTSLILMLVSLSIGSVVFYKYYILPQKIEPELSQEVINFQEDIYKKIIQEWQDRGERLEKVKSKGYPNPFQ